MSAALSQGILSAGIGIGQLAQGIGGFITSGIQAETLKIQAEAAMRNAEFNAGQAEMAGERVAELGKEKENSLMEESALLAGQQSVAFAGQGVKVSTGVAAQVQAQTRRKALEDIDALRSNVAFERLGLRTQAMNLRQQGMAQAGNFRTEATNSLIAGGASLARGVLGVAKTGMDALG